MADAIDISGMDVEKLKALRSKIDAILDGPPSGDGDLDAAVGEMKALREKVASVGKAAVTRAIRGFLGEHPEVHSIRWTQYTPYFNDGDTCEFGVNDVQVRLADQSEDSASESDDDDDEDEGEYVESWDLKYIAEKAGKPKPEALIADMKRLDRLFGESEDALKATFGDHARITVGRDGEAKVEEYDHE